MENKLTRRTALMFSASLVAVRASAQPLQKAKIHHYPGTLLSLVAYVGVEQGVFRKHGLDAELVGVGTGPDALAALLGSGVDVMLNSGDNVMRAIEKGSPEMKVIAGNSRQMPFSVVVRTDVPVATGGWQQAMKSLVGKKLGVIQRGSSTEIIFQSLLRAAGVDADRDVTWLGVGVPPTAIPALQNKVIDAYFAFEPFQTISVRQLKIGKVVLDLRKGEGPSDLRDFPYNFYVATADAIRSKPDLMRRLVAGLAEAHAFMQKPTNLNAVIASAAKYIKMEDALLRSMVQDNLPTFSPVVTDAGMAKWIAFAHQSLGVKREFKPADLLAKDLVPQA